MAIQHHAYKVEVGGLDISEFVTWGADIADAAQRAANSLARQWEGARISSIEYVGTALIAETSKETATALPPAENAPGPARESLGGVRLSRVEQLLAFLDRIGGEAHVRDIALTLATNPANAQNVVSAAVRQGKVERVGLRTGIVRRVMADDHGGRTVTTSSPDRPATAGIDKQKPSRVEQLLELLDRSGGVAHMGDIALHLVTNVPNAQNVVRAAIGQGKVERVGLRTGIVRKAKDHRDTESEALATSPARRPLDGIRLRVWRSLRLLEETRTAAQVARVLGCRPREAGNALALLVGEGRVKADRAQSPTAYEPLLD